MLLDLSEQQEIVDILIVRAVTTPSTGVPLAKLSGAGAPQRGWHLFRNFVPSLWIVEEAEEEEAVCGKWKILLQGIETGVQVMPLVSSKIAE